MKTEAPDAVALVRDIFAAIEVGKTYEDDVNWQRLTRALHSRLADAEAELAELRAASARFEADYAAVQRERDQAREALAAKPRCETKCKLCADIRADHEPKP